MATAPSRRRRAVCRQCRHPRVASRPSRRRRVVCRRFRLRPVGRPWCPRRRVASRPSRRRRAAFRPSRRRRVACRLCRRPVAAYRRSRTTAPGAHIGRSGSPGAGTPGPPAPPARPATWATRGCIPDRSPDQRHRRLRRVPRTGRCRCRSCDRTPRRRGAGPPVSSRGGEALLHPAGRPARSRPMTGRPESSRPAPRGRKTAGASGATAVERRAPQQIGTARLASPRRGAACLRDAYRRPPGPCAGGVPPTGACSTAYRPAGTTAPSDDRVATPRTNPRRGISCSGPASTRRGPSGRAGESRWAPRTVAPSGACCAD